MLVLSVGLIGSGTMGAAMASRLLDRDFQVTVWNRSGVPPELVERGARVAEGPHGVFADGLAVSMLAHDAALEQVFGEELLPALPEGSVHISMATIDPLTAESMAALHERHGVGFVAAPVLGRSPLAAAGQLTVLCSGEAAALERAQPVFDALGKRTWRFGETAEEVGNSLRVKVATNYLIIHALEAMGESIAVLEQSGIDTSRFVEVLGDSLFPGVVYATYGAMIAEERYLPPGFTATLGLKDLNLALAAAERAGLTLPTGGVLTEVFEQAIAAGLGESDWSAIAQVTRASLDNGVQS
ncbi:NAD(P)-dependent oxidoreductase [Nocardioides sp.]|uniref:NAD(P)-dependent oxidoreductase n=1 Tax=Nocardioides sp. TaxID=35761 RepID=UPI003527F166